MNSRKYAKATEPSGQLGSQPSMRLCGLQIKNHRLICKLQVRTGRQASYPFCEGVAASSHCSCALAWKSPRMAIARSTPQAECTIVCKLQGIRHHGNTWELNCRKYAEAAEPTGHLGSQASMQLLGLQEQRSSSHLQTASMQRPSRTLSFLRGRRGKFPLFVRICFGIAWNCNRYKYATDPVPNSM